MSRRYSDLSNTIIHFKRKYGMTYLPLILSTITTEVFLLFLFEIMLHLALDLNNKMSLSHSFSSSFDPPICPLIRSNFDFILRCKSLAYQRSAI